ncbi:rod shape-determining protein RodA [Aciditerrimonas ferrireducens]|jgi:rod shape determining protein RodA|uniref:peptidoglycan glycosyltransferase n=1 Tax=Aciditerrimonas ferrireducens TaxID=667306 RepID=A0ABV6C320_9ACTN|nr:rod shape-determining protein RodA [Aciditerrimonas ferrireducens]MCK4177198.1 rod shape-determining protein RodA [Aciditerrimonas ferrireducens]
MSVLTLPAERRAGVRRSWWRADPLLVGASLVLAAIGVVMVYSATRNGQAALGLGPHYFMERQAIFVVLGLVVMVVLAAVDYHWVEAASTVLYVGIVLALLAMFAIGHRALGATRWINIGPFQLQPSAFAVLAEICVVAAYCARRPEGLETRDLLKILFLQAVPIILVVKQPDLGSAIVLGVVLVVMLIMAGLPNRHLVALVLAAALAAFAMIHFGLLHHYQLERLTSFLHQNQGAQSTTYNLHQSVAAIGSGGLLGTGLFKGLGTNLAFVPEQQTDFIFSAVGEQLGFVGSVAVLVLEAVVCWRLLRAAQQARDDLGRLVAIGAFAFFAFSVFENAGMAMGIMPIAGIPLPFLSYGGSAAVAFFAAIGLALSVQLRRAR